MNTRLLHHCKVHKGIYRQGWDLAGNIHVSTHTITLVRILRAKLAYDVAHNPAVLWRVRRKVLYLGAIAALRAERRLIRAFSL